MKRRRRVSQDVLSRLFQSAAESWRRQEYAETIELLERALRLESALGPARVVQARLLGRAGDGEQTEAILRTVTGAVACGASTRIRAWYELGNVLDRQRRFDEAMTAFLEAKAAQRPVAARPTIAGGRVNMWNVNQKNYETKPV